MRTLQDDSAGLPVDVTIDVGPAPERLESATHHGANWAANEKAFLLDLPGIGRFLATEGRFLTICPAPGMPLEDILVFATGSALAAILYQRGILSLHGSAVIHEGRSFVFCGESGAGKSTLAGALTGAGCEFLADDVSSIGWLDDGKAVIHPDGRMLRLYADSIKRIGLTDSTGPRVRLHVPKFHVAPQMESREQAQGAPLAAIYILDSSNSAIAPGITKLPSLLAAQALAHHTYRRRMALAYSSQVQLVALTASLLSRIAVYHLHRPRDLDCLPETVETLRAHWRGLS